MPAIKPPPMPPPRLQPLPIAQLLQKLPAVPDHDKNAYEKESTANEKGGLPMEIIAAAQLIYQRPPMPPQKGGGPVPLQPGWGGQGKS